MKIISLFLTVSLLTTSILNATGNCGCCGESEQQSKHQMHQECSTEHVAKAHEGCTKSCCAESDESNNCDCAGTCDGDCKCTFFKNLHIRNTAALTGKVVVSLEQLKQVIAPTFEVIPFAQSIVTSNTSFSSHEKPRLTVPLVVPIRI